MKTSQSVNVEIDVVACWANMQNEWNVRWHCVQLQKMKSMIRSTWCSIVHRGLSSSGDPLKDLCDRSNRGDDWSDTEIDITAKVTIGSLLWAVTGDMASLATLVASLASSVERTTVRGSAISGDVTELAASVALHSLSLAISGEVVRSTALVTSSRTWSTNKSSARSESATESTTGTTKTTASAWNRTRTSWAWARTSQMSGLSAVIASTTGTSTAQSKSWAIGLNVSQTLAVVALLSLGSSWQRASVGFVSGLLAVVAKALSRGAHFSIMADIAALVAGTTRE